MRRPLLLIAILYEVLGIRLNSANATTIHVPADQPTIQAGINAAVNGDTVLVAPGTYKDHLDFLGKSIVVRSEFGPEQTTIKKLVDGLSLVMFRSGETPASVLSGFTLKGSTTATYGGAVYCTASPTIDSNVFDSNEALDGGAIHCSGNGAAPLIRGNMFRWNRARQSGAAIFTFSSPTISSNHFQESLTPSTGVIYCVGNGAPAIHENYFVHNQTSCIVLSDNSLSIPSINGNVFFRNQSSPGQCYGTICCNIAVAIDHNTIAYTTGHGVLVPAGSSISNSIILGCTGNGIYFDPYSGVLTVSHNDVLSNNPDYFGVAPDLESISANPMFCDTSLLDFSLLEGSLCLGAGEGGGDIGARSLGCSCSCPCAGDPQCDSVTNVLDVVQTVSVAFRGVAETTDPRCPRQRTDVDCSSVTDILDVVKMVDVAFRGGDPAVKFCNPCS